MASVSILVHAWAGQRNYTVPSHECPRTERGGEKHVLSVLLDPLAAFDNLDHYILLDSWGLEGRVSTIWFHSFLRNQFSLVIMGYYNTGSPRARYNQLLNAGVSDLWAMAH